MTSTETAVLGQAAADRRDSTHAGVAEGAGRLTSTKGVRQ